jgi:unsaturated chondroitin disaccharide hydrolase
MKTVIEQNKEWIDATWEKIEQKLSRTAVKSRNKIPYTTIDGVHTDKADENINWWTNGFWGGMMWLMYVATGKEDYRITAERSEELLERALANYDKLDHDVGFLFHITSGANYRITGNEKARVKNLYAASVLFSRYNVAGDYIRAWNQEGAEGYSIIDCLMNLSLLYWASEEIKDERFKNIAIRHMNMALRDHIRPDGSTNHIVDHEIDRVGVRDVLGGQGYSKTSCWSRGLAWAIYGSVISYIYVGDETYLEAAKRTADYFINHCEETDYLPVIDFEAPKEPVYYDSTAGMCAVCGMLEIAKHVSEEESKRYTQKAIQILQACEKAFCNYDENEDALVLMGSEKYPQNETMMRRIHLPIIYGDFFFVEAMMKLKEIDFMIW